MDLEKIVREYIDKTIHMSLGTSRDNKPWVCEVHFAYDENLNIYWRSSTSRRHSQEIADNPRVAGNIVKQHAPGEVPGGLYFEGTAELLGPGEVHNKAYQAIDARFQLGPDILAQAQQPDGPQFYKVTVETFYLFGRFNDEGVKKHELPWNDGRR